MDMVASALINMQKWHRRSNQFSYINDLPIHQLIVTYLILCYNMLIIKLILGKVLHTT